MPRGVKKVVGKKATKLAPTGAKRGRKPAEQITFERIVEAAKRTGLTPEAMLELMTAGAIVQFERLMGALRGR